MSVDGGYTGGEEAMTNGYGTNDERLEALFAALGAPDPVDPSVAARQVAMAAAEAAAHPAAAPTPPARAPWYRRVLVRGASLGLTAKLLLGTAVAVAATGGAAAGGILPDPIQSFVADTASRVGISLPNPATTTTTTTSTTEPESTTTTSTTLAGAVTTSTTEPGGGDDDEITTTHDTTPGPRAWASTTCAGQPIGIRYTVTVDGRLVLDAVTGEPDDLDADDDRIRAQFGDVRVDIRIDDEVTVDEDRDCGSATSTTSTTIPGSTTTTTADDGGDDDDHEDGDDDHEDDGGDHPQAGPHTWSSTSCSDAPISVAYTVTADGELILGTITGDVDDVETSDDEIRVEFEDGVEVRIQVDHDSIDVDEDRSCGG